MRYYVTEEYDSDRCGLRPIPRLVPIVEQNPSRTCTSSCKRKKFKKSAQRKKKQPYVVELTRPRAYSGGSTNYVLTTQPSFAKQVRCFPIKCSSTNRNGRQDLRTYRQVRESEIKSKYQPPLFQQRVLYQTQPKTVVDDKECPCPCLAPDIKLCRNYCDWRASQLAKEREVAVHELDRCAVSYPDQAYPTSTFVPRYHPPRPTKEEYPEKLIKEEVYENQYEAPKQAYFFASPPRDLKQEKKWSFVKTLNNAFKTITTKERRSLDDPVGICKCGERLNICGPENKRCGGIEGVLIPCGFDCDCRSTKECMEGYLHSLCPCEKPCRCPRDTNRIPDRQPPPPLQQDHRQSTMSGRPGPICCNPETAVPRKQVVRGNVQHQVPELHHGFSDTAVVRKARAEKDCGCDEKKSIARSITEDSVKIKYMPARNHVSDSEECCCSCDDELCDCCCCHGLDVTKKGIQTSRFCFRENCTQTEKSRKKCCRCCRCCTNRGNQGCNKCMTAVGAQNDTCGINGNCYSNGVAGGRLGGGCSAGGAFSNNKCYNTRAHTNTTCCNNATNKTEARTTCNQTLRETKQSRNRSAPTRGKTLMVRTNSIQCCIPTQENKSTNCDYADTISASRIDQFIAELYGGNRETDAFKMQGDGGGGLGNFCRVGGDFRREQPYGLNAEDISRLTKAKLQNFFLDGDVYLSPVSGKNYDLSYRSIDIPTKIASTKIMKPLDVNEQLVASHCFATEQGEHVKLMTSICEAILSTNQNGEIIEEPTKEVPQSIKEGEDFSAGSKTAEVLHTITEDNESSNSSVKNNLVVDAGSDAREEPSHLHQQLIDEIQQNFKDKIDKLEEKIDKLIHDARDSDPKPKPGPKTRTQTPAVLSLINKPRSKPKPEHKPLVTKTGLFGVLPTRSQVFHQNHNPKTIDHFARHNQQGDAKLETAEDESITKYESVIEGNQKHVDDLLMQLEVLHKRNSTLGGSINLEPESKDGCCLQNTADIAYKPDLGTGENFTALDKILKLSSANLFPPGDERGEQVFCLNDIELYNQGASTSGSAKETTKTPTLDFSSVVFTKPDIPSMTAATNSQFSLSSPNFILDNLQSFTTSISDSFTVEKLLNRGISSTPTVDSLFVRTDGSSDDSMCNVDLNCENKV